MDKLPFLRLTDLGVRYLLGLGSDFSDVKSKLHSLRCGLEDRFIGMGNLIILTLTKALSLPPL